MVTLSYLLLAGAPVAIAAPAANILEPSSPWQVDYAENECRLIRTFGSGNSVVTLRIARGGTSDAFDSVIAGPGIPRLPQKLTVDVALEPQGGSQTLDGYSLAVPKTGDRFIRWYDADADLFGRFTSEQIVRISVGGRYQVRLRLAEARAALAAMDTCYADLLKGWGIDPAQVIGLAVRPKPLGRGGRAVIALRADERLPSGPRSWVTSLDYPIEALRQEISGTVVTALQISISGRVENCRVIVSSQSVLLDERSCALLKERAQYAPGQDGAGKPVPSTALLRIRWSIPNR